MQSGRKNGNISTLTMKKKTQSQDKTCLHIYYITYKKDRVKERRETGWTNAHTHHYVNKLFMSSHLITNCKRLKKQELIFHSIN